MRADVSPGRKIAGSTVFVFLLTFVGLGLNYVYGIFLARYLGAESFGLYSLSLSIFNTIVLCSVMGLDHAALYFIPKLQGEGKAVDVGSTISALLLIAMSGSVLVALLLAFFGSHWLADLYGKYELQSVIKAFAFGVPAFVTVAVSFSILQALHDVKRRMSCKYFLEPVAKFVLTGLLFLIGYNVVGAVLGFSLGLWLTFLVMFFTVRRLSPSPLFAVNTSGYPWRKIFAYSSPLLIGLLFNVLAARSDMLLLGYKETIERVGVYGAALQTAAIMSIILQAIESVIAPVISERVATFSKDSEGLSQIYRLSVRWAISLGFLLFIPFVLFAEEILALYGPTFVVGGSAFIILVVGQFINLATGSANYVLLLSAKSKLVMLNGICFGLLQVVMNMVLISRYGLIGAAIAMMVSLSAINLVRILQVYHIYRIHPYSWGVVKPILAAALTLAAGFWLKDVVDGTFILLLIPSSPIFYIVLVIASGLDAADRTMLDGLLGRFRALLF